MDYDNFFCLLDMIVMSKPEIQMSAFWTFSLWCVHSHREAVTILSSRTLSGNAPSCGGVQEWQRLGSSHCSGVTDNCEWNIDITLIIQRCINNAAPLKSFPLLCIITLSVWSAVMPPNTGCQRKAEERTLSLSSELLPQRVATSAAQSHKVRREQDSLLAPERVFVWATVFFLDGIVGVNSSDHH